MALTDKIVNIRTVLVMLFLWVFALVSYSKHVERWISRTNNNSNNADI